MDLHTQGSHLGAPPVSGPHPLHPQRTESSPPEQTVIRTAEFPLAEANQTLLLELGLQNHENGSVIQEPASSQTPSWSSPRDIPGEAAVGSGCRLVPQFLRQL